MSDFYKTLKVGDEVAVSCPARHPYLTHVRSVSSTHQITCEDGRRYIKGWCRQGFPHCWLQPASEEVRHSSKMRQIRGALAACRWDDPAKVSDETACAIWAILSPPR